MHALLFVCLCLSCLCRFINDCTRCPQRRGSRGGRGAGGGVGERWGECLGGGVEQRQSGIIVTDRAAPWWARRCIVCHLTNLNQSIISLSPHHRSISPALRPQRALPAPCCLARVTPANQVSRHRVRPISEHLGQDRIFKERLMNVNALLLETHFKELFDIHVISRLATDEQGRARRTAAGHYPRWRVASGITGQRCRNVIF